MQRIPIQIQGAVLSENFRTFMKEDKRYKAKGEKIKYCFIIGSWRFGVLQQNGPLNKDAFSTLLDKTRIDMNQISFVSTWSVFYGELKIYNLNCLRHIYAFTFLVLQL